MGPKIVIIILPDETTPHHMISFGNLTTKEKEKAFDLLDKELHAVTYKDLEEQHDSMCNLIDDLKSNLEFYQEEYNAKEECRRAIYGEI